MLEETTDWLNGITSVASQTSAPHKIGKFAPVCQQLVNFYYYW